MKPNIKTTILSLCLAALISGTFSSCKKATSYDVYFYAMQDFKESEVTVSVDGKDYGTIHYVQGTVYAHEENLNLVKLPEGRHNISVFDNNKKCIISCYVEMYDNAASGNSLGSGSWGPGGGGENCTGDPNAHNIYIGLYQ